jgi:hypothetical protein
MFHLPLGGVSYGVQQQQLSLAQPGVEKTSLVCKKVVPH